MADVEGGGGIRVHYEELVAGLREALRSDIMDMLDSQRPVYLNPLAEIAERLHATAAGHGCGPAVPARRALLAAAAAEGSPPRAGGLRSPGGVGGGQPRASLPLSALLPSAEVSPRPGVLWPEAAPRALHLSPAAGGSPEGSPSVRFELPDGSPVFQADPMARWFTSTTQWSPEGSQEWRHHMTGRVSSKLAAASTGVLPQVSKTFSSARWRPSLSVSVRRPRERLREVVGSMAFEALSFVLILANAVIASIQIDRFATGARSGRARDRDRGLAWADEVCLAFFLLEVLLRIAAARRKYFTGAMWQWNVLDFALAAWGVLDVSQDRFAFMYLRLLRFFRLVRLLRVTNSVRWLRDLRLMACTLLQSLVSIFWAFVLLFVVIYCFGACFTYAVASHLEEHKDAEGSHQDSRRLLEEFYGSLPRTLCTLLLAITNGAEWKTLAEPLAEVHLAYLVIFATYVILVLVGALNVLTSLFVERARELSMSERDLATQAELASQESFIVEMRRIFDEVDEDKDGLITWQKFRDYLKNEQAQAFFATQALDTSDAARLFSLLDKDGKGVVTVEDFALGCMRLRGQAKSSEVATLMQESRNASRKLMTEIRELKDQLGLLQPSEAEHPALHRGPTNRAASRTPSRARLSRRAAA